MRTCARWINSPDVGTKIKWEMQWRAWFRVVFPLNGVMNTSGRAPKISIGAGRVAPRNQCFLGLVVVSVLFADQTAGTIWGWAFKFHGVVVLLGNQSLGRMQVARPWTNGDGKHGQWSRGQKCVFRRRRPGLFFLRRFCRRGLFFVFFFDVSFGRCTYN